MGIKEKAVWRIVGKLILILIVFYFVVGILQLIGAIEAGVDWANPESLSVKEHLIIQCFGFIGTFGVVFFFRRKLDRRSFLSLGFEIKGRWFDMLAGAGLVVVMLSVGTLVIVLSGQLSITFYLIEWKPVGYGLMFFFWFLFVKRFCSVVTY